MRLTIIGNFCGDRAWGLPTAFDWTGAMSPRQGVVDKCAVLFFHVKLLSWSRNIRRGTLTSSSSSECALCAVWFFNCVLFPAHCNYKSTVSYSTLKMWPKHVLGYCIIKLHLYSCVELLIFGAFAKLRKAYNNFKSAVRPSARRNSGRILMKLDI